MQKQLVWWGNNLTSEIYRNYNKINILLNKRYENITQLSWNVGETTVLNLQINTFVVHSVIIKWNLVGVSPKKPTKMKATK